MIEILNAREERANIISNHKSFMPLVLVKANIPGLDKNLRVAYFLVNLFKKIIVDKYQCHRINYYESSDGPYFLIEVDYEQNNLKKELISLEEVQALGRLIDLDVYYKSYKSFSRQDFNHGFRKCLICNNDAIICVRNMEHSIEDLLHKIDEMVLEFLKAEIKVLVDEAITLEASLDPKFGLVTISSQGSHSDMDYQLLEKSKLAIIDDLVLMFEFGYKYSLDEAYQRARELGKLTEEKMFAVTSKVNTYKGLIFVLGIVLISLGKCFKDYDFNLYDNVSYIGKNLLVELKDPKNLTFGKIAYKKYKITGIRGEVHSGLKSVIKVKRKLKNYSRESLLMTLINLIKIVDDTVLLKRAGSIKKYNYYRDLIGSIQKFDLDKINQITEECIKENLSFGGSADLLVVAILIQKVEGRYEIDYEKKESNRSF